MHLPRIGSFVLGLLAAAALGASAAPAQAKTLDLLVVGDSYSAGVGGGNLRGACLRNTNAWGPVYADQLRARGVTVNFKTVACGGAVVQNLDAQIKSITPETDLVLLTIGGNDVGFANIVIQCFVPLVADPSRCRSAVSLAKRNVPSVQASVLARFDRIRDRLHPGAKIGVISYPYLANPKRYVLRGLAGGGFDAGQAVRELGDLGDAMAVSGVAAVNAQAGYEMSHFIPTKDLFLGHEPDQDPWKENPARWVNEVTGLSHLFGMYHPNRAGYRAMADAVMRAAGPDGDFGVAS